MSRRALPIVMGLVPALGLVGCAHSRAAPVVRSAPAERPAWRAIASAEDQRLLDTAPARWAAALSAVTPRQRRRVEAEGPLLRADAAQPLPALPPGPYHCRLVRLGARGAVTSFRPDYCFVGGDANGLTFTKTTGTTLPGGWVYPDTPTRQVLLGSLRPSADRQAVAYGDHAMPSVAGAIERIAPMRWRLIPTRAGRGALLDVYELVPVPPAVPGAAPVVAAPG